jgi:sugar lactone lactonase YvrE
VGLVILALGLAAMLVGRAPVLAASPEYTNGQAATLVLGQPDFTTNHTGVTDRLLNAPLGVAVDPTTGKVFVVDLDNNRVLRFAALNSLANGASAEAVLGQPDFTTATPGTTRSTMNEPVGVAVDTTGRLWVVDSGNNRVLRFDAAASKPNGAPADGVLGQPDFTSSQRVPPDPIDLNSRATASGMYLPDGIAVDNAGRLWVADRFNNRVLRFDNAAGKPNGAPADGVLGQPDFMMREGGTTRWRMHHPSSIAVDDAGRLWVADNGNTRVLRFDNAASKADGADADGVLGQPDFTSREWSWTASAYRIADPEGIAVDRYGRVWVSDAYNHRVIWFDNAASKPNGADADGVLGQPILTTRIVDTSPDGLRGPTFVAVDHTNSLLVVDSENHRVLYFGPPSSATATPTNTPVPTSTLTTSPPYTSWARASLVLGQPDFSSSYQGWGSDLFYYPISVAVDPASGKVFVSDSYNHRVLRFAALRHLTNGAPAEAVFGQPDFMTRSSAATRSGMNLPGGVTIDSGGRLWVADHNNNRVLRFDNAATRQSGADADGVLGQPNFTSTSYAATRGQLAGPSDVAVDGDGRLWVADSGNDRVVRFDHAAAKPNGGGADGVLGQANFTSSDGTLGRSRLRTPRGIAISDDGRLWVVDEANNRVLRFDAAARKANGADADGVLGQPDFTSNGMSTSATTMNRPWDAAVDSAGRLWVTDTYNNRVLWFDAAAGKPNGGAADGVLGQEDFTSQRVTSNDVYVDERVVLMPAGITLGNGGHVWVVEPRESGVRYFGPFPPPAEVPSHTPTPTHTSSPTTTATATNTPSHTPSATLTHTPTSSATSTNTPSHTPLASATPSLTGTATHTATPSLTSSATHTATASPSPTVTPAATATPTSTPLTNTPAAQWSVFIPAVLAPAP